MQTVQDFIIRETYGPISYKIIFGESLLYSLFLCICPHKYRKTHQLLELLFQGIQYPSRFRDCLQINFITQLYLKRDTNLFQSFLIHFNYCERYFGLVLELLRWLRRANIMGGKRNNVFLVMLACEKLCVYSVHQHLNISVEHFLFLTAEINIIFCNAPIVNWVFDFCTCKQFPALIPESAFYHLSSSLIMPSSHWHAESTAVQLYPSVKLKTYNLECSTLFL